MRRLAPLALSALLAASIGFPAYAGYGPAPSKGDRNRPDNANSKNQVNPAVLPILKAGQALRKRLVEAYAVGLRLDQETRRAKTRLASADVAFDQVHRWLTAKPPKAGGYGGGVLPRLDAAYRNLSASLKDIAKLPSGCQGPDMAQWEAASAGFERFGEALAQAHQVRAQASEYAKQADPKLREAVQWNWSRNHKAAALELDKYRRRLGRDLKGVADALAQGLRAKGLNDPKQLLATSGAGCGSALGPKAPSKAAQGSPRPGDGREEPGASARGGGAEQYLASSAPAGRVAQPSLGPKAAAPAKAPVGATVGTDCAAWRSERERKLADATQKRQNLLDGVIAELKAKGINVNEVIKKINYINSPCPTTIGGAVACFEKQLQYWDELEALNIRDGEQRLKSYGNLTQEIQGLQTQLDKPPQECRDTCPAKNVACRESPSQHKALTKKEDITRVNQSLALLNETTTDSKGKRKALTETGRKVLAAVLGPGAKRFDLAALSAAGVEVRVAADAANAEMMRGGKFERVTAARGPDGKIYVAVVLRQDVLNPANANGARAQVLGHALSHAEDKRTGKHGGSVVLSEQKAYLTDVFIGEELKAKGKLCANQTTLCQDLRFTMRVWEDELAKRGWKAGEFEAPYINALQEAKKKEKLGRRGTEQLFDLIHDKDQGFFTPQEQKDQAQMSAYLDNLDKEQRRSKGFVLPAPKP